MVHVDILYRGDMRVGVTDYIMHYYWREFNEAIFYDSPNCHIKVLAKFSRYTVQ